MSLTVTVTRTRPEVQQQAVTLRLTPQISTKDKVYSLIEKMKSSSLFSPAQKKIVLDLPSKFDAESFKDLTTEEGKENGSIALSLLVSDAIYPAIKEEADEEKQNQLLDLEDEIKSILKEILPEGVSIDDFIDENEKFSYEQATEQAILQEQLFIIDACFQNQMGELFGLANISNQQLKQSFEILKQRLLELNSRRKEMAGDLHGKLDTLTKKVDAISKKLENDALSVQEIAQKMKNEEHQFHQLIGTCQNIFKKV
jgi:hypothetical protein